MNIQDPDQDYLMIIKNISTLAKPIIQDDRYYSFVKSSLAKHSTTSSHDSFIRMLPHGSISLFVKEMRVKNGEII